MSNKIRIFLGVVLAVFALETAVVVYMMGYVGFFEAAFANYATRLMLFDLAICLSLIAVWMWRDARERGVNPIPYVALSAALGAAGPLLYLVRRPARDASAPESAGARATQLA